MKRGNWMIAGATGALYFGSLFAGLQVTSLRAFGVLAKSNLVREWQPPLDSNIPTGTAGDTIREGRRIFEHTALYAPRFTSSQMSCASCHAAGGIQPFAAPLVGVPGLYPRFSRRAGRVITLRDRINECFVRSENGKPLPDQAPEMKALLAYLDWLSAPEPGNPPFQGRGLAMLPAMQGNPQRGGALYTEQCAGCHGEDGLGISPLFPPLWGPDSFNDGAGMDNVRKMASFVEHNMPQNRMGILTPQQSFDIASFVHEQKRPHFNPAYNRY
jgi:thiosulfate dehydrogenase